MNNTIFITGASSGIGKATVEFFAKEGWQVAATVKKAHLNTGLFNGLPNVSVFELDVTDWKQVEHVAESVIQKFKKIDVVVNNAGYCLMGPTETSAMEQIKRQYETNVFGVFAVIKAFTPHFRENRKGMFINIASSSARFNYPFIGAYGSSKWAVRGLTECLGIELAPFNIEVKAIYPGTHATSIFTKLDDGTGNNNEVFQFYKPYYKNFFSSQSAITRVTAPSEIAKQIWRAVNKPKGKLHIVSGGDARAFEYLKRILPQRIFQKLQIRSIMRPANKWEIGFVKWLMGKNTEKISIEINKQTLI